MSSLDSSTDRWPSGLNEALCSYKKYIIYYPVVLAIAALLLWIYPTDLITAISSAVGTVIFCLMLWEFFFTNSEILLSRVCAMGLLLAYATGTLNSWLTISRGSHSLASVIGQTAPELANGVAAALMGCAVLLSLGELIERPVLGGAQALVMTSRIRNIVLISFVVIAAAFATGKFHQGGAVGAGAGRAGVIALFLDFLLPPTFVFAIVIALVEPAKSRKYLFGAVAICLLAFEMTQGRRNVVYPVFVAIALARYSGYRWGKLSVRRILLIGAGLALVFVGVLTYQLLRLAGGKLSSHSISVQAGQVEQWAKQGRAWKIATMASESNVKTRTLEVIFLSSVLHQTMTKPPAHGKDLYTQLEAAVPSALDRNKHVIAEETLASQTFGVFYPDLANSLFTAGAVDFGIWGVLIYPILMILIYSSILRLVSKYASYEVFLYGLACFVQTSMAAENQISAYFVSVRDFLIFMLFLYAITKFPRFRWKLDETEKSRA